MDSRKFRNALGQFPTGVVVATARAPTGELIGMTMSSFNSVSLDPPLISICLGHAIAAIDVFRQSRHFGLSILREN